MGSRHERCPYQLRKILGARSPDRSLRVALYRIYVGRGTSSYVQDRYPLHAYVHLECLGALHAENHR